MKTCDYLVIGAGVIGLCVARNLQCKYPGSSIVLIDKESRVGEHASGRNSGVLHSGIYYSADSLKANFTRQGNEDWQIYCEEKKLSIDKCGKLIIASTEDEVLGFEELLNRGKNNQVNVQYVSTEEIAEIDPFAKSNYPALFVPSTATVNPVEIIESIKNEFVSNGGELLNDCAYISRKSNNDAKTSFGIISAGYMINCAGLYADKVAHEFGFGARYKILPFKGLYLYAQQEINVPRTHIYPVPDLHNPFLGVHLTRTMSGGVKIGPTAIPALWRENYRGFDNFKFPEMIDIFHTEMKMFLGNYNNFRSLAWAELQKQSKGKLINSAGRLVDKVNEMGFTRWGKTGIRAQLFDLQYKKLEMDFVLEGDEHTLHVLNAVSPAFTCALPFAKHIVDTMVNLRSGV
tara:strand:- start:48036 stop:49244 length:1209 start_codon:yes stop_codon:yes gene_type:complete